MFETQSNLPVKRVREESDPESDSDDMDFQQTENVTATQALADTDHKPGYLQAELPPPLTPEHAALRADFQIITEVAMENLYNRMITDIKKSADDTNTALQRTNNQLQNQIVSLGARVTKLQERLLSYECPAELPIKPPPVPATASTKKLLKLQLAKKNASADAAANTTPTTTDTSHRVPSTTPVPPAVNTRRWETVQSAASKPKVSTPKLIATKYPQAEREVICYFQSGNTDDANGIHHEKTYAERLAIADVALHRINSVLINNKDVVASPFIRARVTIRGTIIFTTSNDQNNVVYEHYTNIIADALSYHGVCEKVEIGKRFSQFLLHGVPTHLSLPEISDSITTNYPQLIQGQTPRWLTTAERREQKTNSTIVMTLTGNVKKASIGRQNLIVCNRECQLDDYIPYGRSTQCHNCQNYGHPAALCRNDSRCAVCANPHNTREHPCTLPTCKKGPACTHPPIHCVNCNAPHKANDPNCPERIKLRTFGRTATTGDAPMAGAAN
jgi:hypothetical protein